MYDAKKPGVPLQEKMEELTDAQLSQVNGGRTIPMISSDETSGGVKLGQALKKTSAFTKSDDRLP